MTSTSSIQKAARSQALTVAKAALKGHGAAEAGSKGVKVKTAGTGRAKGHAATVKIVRQRLRKTRIRV